jgi:hypothetical protein
MADVQLDLHLVVENYATHKHPKVRTWLAQRPRCPSIRRDALPALCLAKTSYALRMYDLAKARFRLFR